MLLARVIGTVVATVKDDALKGIKLMVVQVLDEGGTPRGAPEVAADAVGYAGPGDHVFLATRKEAAFPLGDLVPVDLSIAGFVDTVTLEK
jgi:ethanolamine utilization protein EutN